MNSKEEMFDYTRVKDQFSKIVKFNPNEIIDKLVTAGDQWMDGRHQDDDITIVVIRVK